MTVGEIIQKAQKENLMVYDEELGAEVYVGIFHVRHNRDEVKTFEALQKAGHFTNEVVQFDKHIYEEASEVPDEVIAVEDIPYEAPKESPEEGAPAEPQDQKGYALVGAELFNAGRHLDGIKGPLLMLLYLINNKGFEGKKDKHKTGTYWYIQKKLIVASRSRGQMAVDLGVTRRTITNWINELKQIGWIKVVQVGKENVYVLGEVAGKNEVYYYGHTHNR